VEFVEVDRVRNKNKLYVNKPNLKYEVEGQEIVVPVDKNFAKNVKVENETIQLSKMVENELASKQKELEKLQAQIAVQEEKLKSLAGDAMKLPVVNENSKKVEAPAKQQVVLPYKLAKSESKPEIAAKKIEYPKDVKKEFEKVYMSENKYLTLLETEFEEDDVFYASDIYDPLTESDFETYFADNEVGPVPFEAGFNLNNPGVAQPDVVVENNDLLNNLDAFSQESVISLEGDKKIDILQMKIGFEEGGSSVNSKNIELISSFASVVLNNPANGVEIYVSDQSLTDAASKKLMAKRLAMVSRVLKDQGIKEYQIKPVLAKRPFNSVVLKIVDLDTYKQKTAQKYDAFGNVIKQKAYRSIDW
jgi:outer membrane protein OmpA-like peptidoglycan-associated protein